MNSRRHRSTKEAGGRVGRGWAVAASLVLLGALSACTAQEDAGVTDPEARAIACKVAARAPRDVVGFVGDGALAVADKFRAAMLVTIGNHSDPQTIQNLLPGADPDYSRGRWVVRRIAKLDGRLDGLGYSIKHQEADISAWIHKKVAAALLPGNIDPTTGQPIEPAQYVWWGPNPKAMLEADASQLREAVLRDIASGASGRNVWEISNEPNYFPAITPQQYAALFVEYASFIRAIDPRARIAIGALWSADLVMDQAIFRQVVIEAATAKLLSTSLQFPPGLVPAALLALLGNEVGNLFADRVLGSGGKAVSYLAAALNAIPDDAATRIGAVDVSFHAYPFDARAPIGDKVILKAINKMASETAAEVAKYNRRTGRSHRPGVYVTEYGNVVGEKSEVEVGTRVQAMTENFVNNANIKAAFFFKGIGVDAGIVSFLGGTAPLSRVIADPNYVVPFPTDTANPFPCAALNSVGHWFHAYLNGAACTDAAAAAP